MTDQPQTQLQDNIDSIIRCAEALKSIGDLDSVSSALKAVGNLYFQAGDAAMAGRALLTTDQHQRLDALGDELLTLRATLTA